MKTTTRGLALTGALTSALLLASACSDAEDNDAATTQTGAADVQLQQALQRAGVQGSPTAAQDQRMQATLRLADNREAGTAYFWPAENGAGTTVLVDLSLPEGVAEGGNWHGLHVHANNDPANGEGCQADAAQPASEHFASADGHFSQEGTQHAAHAGDLAPVFTRGDRTASSVFTTDKLAMADLRGKALVLHADRDNLGHVPTGTGPEQYRANSPQATDLTNRTGNAGARVACGVIGNEPAADAVATGGTATETVTGTPTATAGATVTTTTTEVATATADTTANTTTSPTR